MKGFLFLSIVLLLSSCLDSPILNHRKASPPLNGNTPSQSAETSQLTNCSLKFGSNLCASYRWIVGPTRQKASELEIWFWVKENPDEKIIPSESVAVELYMPPPMDHPWTRPETMLRSEESKVFDVTKIDFGMRGHWEVWVRLKRDSQTIAEDKIDVFF